MWNDITWHNIIPCNLLLGLAFILVHNSVEPFTLKALAAQSTHVTPVTSHTSCSLLLNETSFSKPPIGKSRNAQCHSFIQHLVSGPHSSSLIHLLLEDETTQKQPDRWALDKQYPFSMNILGRLSLRHIPFFTDMLLLHAPAILRGCIFLKKVRQPCDSCFLWPPLPSRPSSREFLCSLLTCLILRRGSIIPHIKVHESRQDFHSQEEITETPQIMPFTNSEIEQGLCSHAFVAFSAASRQLESAMRKGIRELHLHQGKHRPISCCKLSVVIRKSSKHQECIPKSSSHKSACELLQGRFSPVRCSQTSLYGTVRPEVWA